MSSYDYETGEIPNDVARQTEKTLVNVDRALREAGSFMIYVVRVHYILPNRVVFLGRGLVLRKWVGHVRLMKEEMKIEIEVTAKRGCGMNQ